VIGTVSSVNRPERRRRDERLAHPEASECEAGRVGRLQDELSPGGAAQSKVSYLVIYEKCANGWGAYVPDLPGLGVAGATLDEVKQLIREAMDFHLEGMREHGDPIPEPSAVTEYVSVS